MATTEPMTTMAASASASRRHTSNRLRNLLCDSIFRAMNFLGNLSSIRWSPLRSQSCCSHFAIFRAHSSTNRNSHGNVQKCHMANKFPTANVSKCINCRCYAKFKCSGRTNIILVCNANTKTETECSIHEKKKKSSLKNALMQSNVRETFYLGDIGLQSKQELRNRKKIAHFSCTRFSYTHYMCCQNYKACMQERYLRKTMKIEQSFFSLSLLTKCVYARVDLCEVIREKDDDGEKKLFQIQVTRIIHISYRLSAIKIKIMTLT